MTSAMTAFGIAGGGTSLICYALMTRLQNRRGNRRSSGDNASADGGNYVGGGGRTIAHWFGGGHSGLDSSGNPSDTNGSDSGGGGSEGGGGGRGAALAEAISACASAGKVQHFDLPQHRFFRAVLVCIPHQFGIT